jgi:membrane-bound lytic murein transglycosylase MltF
MAGRERRELFQRTNGGSRMIKVPEPGPELRRMWQLSWRVLAVAAALFLQVHFLKALPRTLTGGETAGLQREVPPGQIDFSPLSFDEAGKAAAREEKKSVAVKEELPPPQSAPARDFSIARELFTGDLDGIRGRRNIRVLITFNRTNFFIDERGQHGFEYSLLRDYEKELNKGKTRRDLQVHMEFVPVHRDQLIPMLLKGEGDIAAAGLTVTDARLEKVDFTDPYLTGIDELVVTHYGVNGLGRLEDLSGRRVAVRESSSYYESLRALNERFREEGVPAVKIRKIREGLETEGILEIVNTGEIGITIADSHLAHIWSGVHRNLRVRDDLKVREGGRIAWMIRKNSPLLRESLNSFIQTRRKGSKFGNIYFKRYFKDEKWVTRRLTEERLEKVKEYLPIFKKYAAMYDIPWPFIVAVAFQESGFDNSKRSAAGAVGIMQVLPSTAGDKNVGIDDIADLENNIHAGTKYLAFLRDRYFPEGEIDLQNRIHFTLASYNAGPANVARARKKAPGWDVDEDRWFKNVEVVALRTISPEPVQYVVNIHRYFLLFQEYFGYVQAQESMKKDYFGD